MNDLDSIAPQKGQEPADRARVPEIRGPDRHRAVEERRDLDASLEKLKEEERQQRDARRRAPGGLPGFVVGTPDIVHDYFDEYMKTGANYMVLSFQWGSLSHEQAMRSIRLFKDNLMGEFGVSDPFSFGEGAAIRIRA